MAAVLPAAGGWRGESANAASSVGRHRSAETHQQYGDGTERVAAGFPGFHGFYRSRYGSDSGRTE
ncbi:hypothetical protein GCM10018987_34490 [Streptomyces cremeus]